MIHHQKDVFESQEEYDEYMSNTPLEARFDPLTIQMLTVEAIPKHAAYDMTFGEYLKQRSRFSEYDQSEKKRLGFYLPVFPAMRSQDFAYYYKVSLHRFLVMLIELGLITFLYDYHSDISTAKQVKMDLSKTITTERARMRYMQINKQTISLNISSGYRNGSVKRFTPYVPEWMYNAATDKAADLNMTIADMAYICWNIGAQKTLDLGMVDPVLDRDISTIMQTFQFELEAYIKRLNELTKDSTNESVPSENTT